MEQMPGDRARLETLAYIQAMLMELCAMARHERFDMVAYLTEMACTEARDILDGVLPLGSVGSHDKGDGT